MTENKRLKNALKEWTEFEESGYSHGALPTSATLSIIKNVIAEIQQYRAIGTVDECAEMQVQYNYLSTKIKKYESIGTVEEIKKLISFLSCDDDNSIIDDLELLNQYRSLGTVEDIRKNSCKIPIATITFSKEELQNMVDEKMKEIELDIQAIRNQAIDDFAETLKSDTMAKTFGLRICDVDRIAEQMKGEENGEQSRSKTE